MMPAVAGVPSVGLAVAFAWISPAGHFAEMTLSFMRRGGG
jgi:hypothetical protein